MRFLSPIALGLFSLIMIGCEQAVEDRTGQMIDSLEASAAVQVPDFESPDPADFQTVTLQHGAVEVRLGETPQNVERAFDVPDRSFPMGELPFEDGHDLTVHGWQSSNEGLGIISRDSRVVLILHTFERASERLAEELVANYNGMRRHLTAEIQGENVRYWFYEDRGQRLMLVRNRDRRGNLHVTIALGVPEMMDVLRMSPAHAQEDADEADRLLARPSSGDEVE